MSTILLWFILGTRIAAAIITRNGAEITPKIENQTLFQDGNEFLAYNSNRRIVVEEVDKHGNSVVKELELPNYDESEEQKENRRMKIPEREEKNKSGNSSESGDLYGCHSRREGRRKKCLQRKKKFIKGRYKSWKALIRQIIKDLDGKIKTIERGRRKENLNLMSGFSPKNVMRKKE